MPDSSPSTVAVVAVGAMWFCCGALCKVPKQVYSFLLEVPLILSEELCCAPSRAELKPDKWTTTKRLISFHNADIKSFNSDKKSELSPPFYTQLHGAM